MSNQKPSQPTRPSQFSSSQIALEIIDDSMSGTFEPGDMALIDTAIRLDLTEGCIVAVKLKTGEQLIRRFYKKGRYAAELRCDNQNYKPLIYDPIEFETMHRVVKIIKNV